MKLIIFIRIVLIIAALLIFNPLRYCAAGKIFIFETSVNKNKNAFAYSKLPSAPVRKHQKYLPPQAAGPGVHI
ncbi:hypothetical protein ND23_004855 [Escherichia coli]|nr:hypothetical protein [Escherichia coli]